MSAVRRSESFASGSVCGVDIAAISPDLAGKIIVAAASEHHALQVHLCNAYTLSLVERDGDLRSALACADVAACETPSYATLGDDEVRALAARVEAAGTNVMWIGLGTPRQDHLVRRISALVTCPVIPVGAAFDFLAGRVPEAPCLLPGSGLEWMYRLICEPRRLWRRYLIGNPRFLLLVARRAFGQPRS